MEVIKRLRNRIPYTLTGRKITALDEFNPYSLPRIERTVIKKDSNGQYPSLPEKLKYTEAKRSGGEK